jgi:hypothetical protein
MDLNKAQLNEKATDLLEFGILVVCEDEGSNYTYLQAKAAKVKRKIKFDFFNGNSQNPLASPSKKIGLQTHKLTDFAIKIIAELNRRHYNEGQELDLYFYQEVYIVGDVDDNEYQHGKYVGNITKAFEELQIAQAVNPIINYKLLLSNECFEVWYILHFQDITEPLYRDIAKYAALFKAYGSNKIREVLKNITGISFKQQKTTDKYFEIMQEKGDELQAIQRAKNLAKTKQPTEKFARNPSTDVYILIEMLNNLK